MFFLPVLFPSAPSPLSVLLFLLPFLSGLPLPPLLLLLLREEPDASVPLAGEAEGVQVAPGEDDKVKKTRGRFRVGGSVANRAFLMPISGKMNDIFSTMGHFCSSKKKAINLGKNAPFFQKPLGSKLSISGIFFVPRGWQPCLEV